MKRLENSPAREAYLDLVRASERLTSEFAQLFAGHGLSLVQFNVLRLLVEAPDGLSCQAIGDGLLHRQPDVTRLVDRMCAAGLAERSRSESDRRVVLVHVTAEGRERCEALYVQVNSLHREQLGHIPEAQLATLSKLLRLAARCDAASRQ